MTVDVIGPSVVGQPVVWGTGILVLAVLAWPATAQLVQPFLTIVHEGGHMVVSLLTGRGLKHFELDDRGGGATYPGDASWGAGWILSAFSGYIAPPLVGLGGANLVIEGKSWSVLWVALAGLLGAWSQFKGATAGAFVLLFGAGIAYVAIAGAPATQAILAVAIVWLLLLGGVENVATLTRVRRNPGADSNILARATWIPGVVWIAVFWFIAVVCLWIGARRLTGL